jgi:hypothetical protein
MVEKLAKHNKLPVEECKEKGPEKTIGALLQGG